MCMSLLSCMSCWFLCMVQKYIHGSEAICRLCNKNDVNLIPSVLKICVGMGCCVAAELLGSWPPLQRRPAAIRSADVYICAHSFFDVHFLSSFYATSLWSIYWLCVQLNSYPCQIHPQVILDCSTENATFYEKCGLSIKGTQMAKYFWGGPTTSSLENHFLPLQKWTLRFHDKKNCVLSNQTFIAYDETCKNSANSELSRKSCRYRSYICPSLQLRHNVIPTRKRPQFKCFQILLL